MTKMLPASFGPNADVFGDLPKDDKLSTGIRIGYPILRIKGKVWAITRGGNEPHVLMRPDGDGPRNSIDVVILAASQYVSKVWYEQGYVEGSTDAPDCFSANGVVPDASSTKKQNNTCDGCKQNAWGSRITPAGKKAKACQDSKRVAVSPLGDIRNEAFGGPMMLRVPAASLSDFGNYGDGLDARGYKYFTVGTKMSFDAAESYPKLVLEPIRPLNNEEATAVLELRASSAIQAILAEDVGTAQETAPSVFDKLPPVSPVTPQVTQQVTKPVEKPAPVAPVVMSKSDGFGEPAPDETPAPRSGVKASKKVQVAAPSPQPTVTSPPAQQEEAATAGSFEDTLDAELESLLPGSA